MGGWGLPQTYDDLKEVVGLPGRPVFPGHHGGASGIATQGLKTMSLRREKELKPPRHASPQHGGLQAQGTRGVGHARAPAAPSQGCGRRTPKPKRPDPRGPQELPKEPPMTPILPATVAGANTARRTNLTRGRLARGGPRVGGHLL